MNDGAWSVVEGFNYWDKPVEASVPREVTQRAEEMLGGFEAHYFLGPRRAGKTTVCFQLLEKLSAKHGKHSCLYINFEEPSFSAILSTQFIEEVVAKFEEIFGKPPKFVFLDEAQNVPQWEKWVRIAVDRKRFKVFVTGSSAKLLSSEFSTSLGGRGLKFLVMPFSWRECKRARPKASFDEYLSTGGYPAVVLEENPQKRERLLQEYFDTAITRDIAARHEVRDVPTLRNLALYVLTNSGKPFSYNTLREMTGLSFDAIRQYLSYLEEAYLVLQVPHFSYSLKKTLEKPRKYYAADLGMQSAVSKSFSPDYGRRIENAVAIDLFSQGKEIFYYKEKNEVDFVVKEGLDLTAINVCAAENPPEREQKGLQEFAAAHKAKIIMLAGQKAIENWMEKQERRSA